MKIYTYRLDEFLNGNQNKLLITGIVGAGKTYNGKLIAKVIGCNFGDFDSYFYNNRDLKISNPDEYNSKRKIFESDLFFSNARAVVAGRRPILTNISNHNISSLPIIILDTNIYIATIRAILRNIKSIFTASLYSYWKNELIFPLTGNLEFKINLKEINSQYPMDSLKIFNSMNSLIEYINSFPQSIKIH